MKKVRIEQCIENMICLFAISEIYLNECYEQLLHLESLIMDKEIRKIEKGVKKTGKELKVLKKKDVKRDPACEYGEKMMKKRRKKKKK